MAESRAPESFRPSSRSLSEGPRRDADTEQFLLYLYRGSELLHDDRLAEAESELQRAIAVRPFDLQATSLLAVTYLKSSRYEEAIALFETLRAANPNDPSVLLNLSLCHLRTNQPDTARMHLETLVSHAPNHTRAWGYLAVAYQQLGEHQRAKEASEKSGRREVFDGGEKEPPLDEDRLLPRRVTNHPLEHRTNPPAGTLEAAESSALLFPQPGSILLHPTGFATASIPEDGFAARLDSLRLFTGSLSATPISRRVRGLSNGESLGGPRNALVLMKGEGELGLVSRPGHIFATFRLQGQRATFREDCLAAFDGGLSFENDTLCPQDPDAIPVITLNGSGPVLVETMENAVSLRVAGSRGVEIRKECIVGWIGTIVASPVSPNEAPGGMRGLLRLTGEGTLFLSRG